MSTTDDSSTTPKRRTGKPGNPNWTKGVSGHPAGRTPAHGVAVKELRAKIAEHTGILVDRVLLSALAGDMSAAKLLLDKILPSVRPESLPLALSPLPDGKTWTERAQHLFDAAMRGELPHDVASELIGALSRVVTIEAVDDMRRRLDALEGLA